MAQAWTLREKAWQAHKSVDALISEALAASGGNVAKAAELLGVSRQALYGQIARRKYQAERESPIAGK